MKFIERCGRTAAGSLVLGFALTVAGLVSASASDLPPVPKALKNAGVLRVGTKCDYPPEGFLDNSGQPVGVEVSMAHQIAKYAFGDAAKAKIVCVTTANRVPALLGNKVDLLIATMAITPAREKVVKFSQPYAWSSQGVVVRADSPYKAVADLKGKPVTFVKGAIAISYFEKNYPSVKELKLDSVSDAIQALMSKRVEGYAHDTPVLMSLASHNKNIRLLDKQFRVSLRAAALRPGEDDLLKFVNASLDKMAKDGLYRKWFETYAKGDDIEAKLNFWDMSKRPAN